MTYGVATHPQSSHHGGFHSDRAADEVTPAPSSLVASTVPQGSALMMTDKGREHPGAPPSQTGAAYRPVAPSSDRMLTLDEKVLQREKLAALGQLLSGVAHELDNPLAGIMAFSQILLSSLDEAAEERNALVTIQKEAQRAAKIVSNLLVFARQHHPERAEIDLNRVLLDTLELRGYALRAQQIRVVTALDPALPKIWADRFQLQQAFLNLLINAEQALEAKPSDKRVVLGTRCEGSCVVASISDSGPGIPEELLGRIFEPFYSSKPEGEGTGLGLSISDSIIREHGGRIRVHSCVGEGATFSVELPLLGSARHSDVGRLAAGSIEATSCVVGPNQ